MSKIDLQLTIEEANLVLEALGQLPFVRVYALIGRIQAEARAQVARGADDDEVRPANGHDA